MIFAKGRLVVLLIPCSLMCPDGDHLEVWLRTGGPVHYMISIQLNLKKEPQIQAEKKGVNL